MTDDTVAPVDPQWPDPVPPWPADFPDVVTQTTLESLYASALQPGEELAEGSKSAAYLAAKAGDVDAAGRVVRAIVSPDVAEDIGRQFLDATVVSVHAEERAGRNKLPTVYATALGEIAGLSVDDSIIQVNRVHHTGANARQRLARRPLFAGEVQRGRDYVLVDDVITSGASLAALRHFVEARGGQVVLVTTLAAAEARHGMTPTRLPITALTAVAIDQKFARSAIDAILVRYGVAPSIYHLTESEGRTVLGFDSADALRSSLVAAGQATDRA